MIKKTLLKTTSLITLAIALSAFSPVSANAAWKQNSTGWWYTEGNSYATGWRQISGTWYYFDANGYMKTGWVNDGGSWYFMDGTGAMKTGWVKSGSCWYYMSKSGVMQTGWINDCGSWYYLDGTGAMLTGWIIDGNNEYFLDDNGVMLANSWISYDEQEYYYVGPSGVMVTGFYTVDGTKYYFYSTGLMATNDMVDGYFIDETGAVSSKKADVKYAAGDALMLIGREDSTFINNYESKIGHDCAFDVMAVANSSYVLEEYNVSDEIVYLIFMYNSAQGTYADPYMYFVGATTGKVYSAGVDDYSKLYEIKDNTIVNSYFSKHNPNASDWR